MIEADALTPDMGGNSSTSQVGDRVTDALQENHTMNISTG